MELSGQLRPHLACMQRSKDHMLVELRAALARPRPSRAWSDEFDDAVRGLASGFLIGIPVDFSVDSWWLGDQNEPLD